MSALHRLHYHFLPHFTVDPGLAHVFGGHNKVHHRAHALSPWSLFAYLQILLVLTAGLYVIRLKAPQILGTVTFSADQIISLTNEKRAQNGLGGVSYSPLLAQAAAGKAQDMLKKDYWAHNSPTGATPWSFITSAGYRYVFAGENLARDFDSAPSVVDAWMNSPSHRSNLLDKNFKEIGVAVVSGELSGREGILVVQMFGTAVSQVPVQTTTAEVLPTPQAAASPPVEPSPSPVEIASVSFQEPAAVMAARQFSIAKGASLALVGFIFTLFALEVVVTLRRSHVGLKPGVVAHLAVLGFVLFAVWYAVGGSVL